MPHFRLSLSPTRFPTHSRRRPSWLSSESQVSDSTHEIWKVASHDFPQMILKISQITAWKAFCYLNFPILLPKDTKIWGPNRKGFSTFPDTFDRTSRHFELCTSNDEENFNATLDHSAFTNLTWEAQGHEACHCIENSTCEVDFQTSPHAVEVASNCLVNQSNASRSLISVCDTLWLQMTEKLQSILWHTYHTL